MRYGPNVGFSLVSLAVVLVLFQFLVYNSYNHSHEAVSALVGNKQVLQSSLWSMCWPSRCEEYGLCKTRNMFIPKISLEKLLQCPDHKPTVEKRPDQPISLQLFHLSKCGGTTLNKLFSKPSLTDKGKKLYLGERENYWDKSRYSDGKKPLSTFILGTIRNPFEYYVSFWSMLSREGEEGYSKDCHRHNAFKSGRFEVFNNRGVSNPLQFRKWLYFELIESCDPCVTNMWRAFQQLYIGMEGDCPSIDALVRQEDYYPTLLTALKAYEEIEPDTIVWPFVNDFAAQKKSYGGLKVSKCPIHCYYDSFSRSLVEKYDEPIFVKYKYSFNQVVLKHGGPNACVGTCAV